MEQCFLSHDTFWNTNFTKHGIFRNCHRLFREVIWYSHYEHPKCEILVNHIWSLCVFKTIFHFCSLFSYLIYSEAKFHDRAKFSKLFHHMLMDINIEMAAGLNYLKFTITVEKEVQKRNWSGWFSLLAASVPRNSQLYLGIN